MKKLVLVAFLLVNISAYSADSDGSGATPGQVQNNLNSNNRADSDGSGAQPKSCTNKNAKSCNSDKKVNVFDWLTDLLR
ncbi:hypothetical protein [Marinicella sp. W31]|uniref:hypothetical protein n=1 Tax=Marinicella sp. W31 TaxID=3023713 RepID=UPI003757D16F